VLVAAHGSDAHRTATAIISGICFAVVGLFTSQIVPSGKPHPETSRPEHAFTHHAGGMP
jgi:hypothetical protein